MCGNYSNWLVLLSHIETIILKKTDNMVKTLFLTALIAIMTIPASAQQGDSFPVQVKVENGTIEGNYDTRSGLQMYFGVPFAKPVTVAEPS